MIPDSRGIGTLEFKIIFSKKDVAGIHPHENDTMVLTVRWDN